MSKISLVTRCFGLAILILFGLNSCSIKHIDEKLEPHYNLYRGVFELNCNKKIIHDGKFIMAFVDNPALFMSGEERKSKTIAAICSRNGLDRFIFVKRSFWTRASEATRQLTVFHEMSHCFLNLNHVEKPIGHYMNPSIPEDTTKIELYNQLVKDVRDNCSKL